MDEKEISYKEKIWGAKNYFKTLKRRHKLAVKLRKEYTDISYLICVVHIESLANIKHPKMNSGKRFKKIIREFGGQTDDFNKKYVNRVWHYYRCNVVHDMPIPREYFENDEKESYGILEEKYFPEIVKRSIPKEFFQSKFIKTEKMLDITKNCLDNVEKELKMTDKSILVFKETAVIKNSIKTDFIYRK